MMGTMQIPASSLKYLTVAMALCGLLAMGGCRSAKTSAVKAIGSTSILPFAEMLSEEFNPLDPNCQIEVLGGGSTAGLQAVADHMAEIGMCSRALTPDETTLYAPIVIAWDGLAVVVHPGNPLSELSLEQISDIFSGKVTDWSQVGGQAGPVRIITREEGSGTREAFQKLVMHDKRISRKAVTQESNGAVKELVTNDPGTIGYMSLGLVSGLKTLKVATKDKKSGQVQAVEATSANIVNESYPLRRPFLFVTARGHALSPAARAFVDFVLSPRSQAMLETEGLVKISETRKAD